MPCGQKTKNIKQKQYCNKFNKDFKNCPHQKSLKKNLKKKKKKKPLKALHPVSIQVLHVGVTEDARPAGGSGKMLYGGLNSNLPPAHLPDLWKPLWGKRTRGFAARSHGLCGAGATCTWPLPVEDKI